MKLESYADRLKPIDYCVRDKCKYYELATVKLPICKKKLKEKKKELERTNAIDFRPALDVYNFDAVPVESRVMLTEGDIYEARMYQDMMRQHGIPDCQIPCHKDVSFMVEEAKEKCIRNLLNEAKQFAGVEVDEESRWPGIVITARMMVGKRRDGK